MTADASTEVQWITPSTSPGAGGAVEACISRWGPRTGLVVLRRHGSLDILAFTTAEWDAFVECVKAGEFG